MLPLALLKTAQGHPVVRFVWSCAPVAPTWAQAGAGMCLEQRSCIGSHPIVLPSPLAADRTQERRDVQWAPCSVRYLDERAPAGSHLHRKGALFVNGLGWCIVVESNGKALKCTLYTHTPAGWRSVLEDARGLHQREHHKVPAGPG